MFFKLNNKLQKYIASYTNSSYTNSHASQTRLKGIRHNIHASPIGVSAFVDPVIAESISYYVVITHT